MRFFHTYAEEGAIGLAVTVAKSSHPSTLELALLRKALMRLQASRAKAAAAERR